jgi:hypothetical protein
MYRLILIFCMFFIVTEVLAQPDVVRRKIQDQGGQVFNVKAWGAKGDTTTDDKIAIQRTLDTAGYYHATVYIPQGVYSMTDTAIGTQSGSACLHIPSNVTLIVDNNATLKRAASQGNNTYLLLNKDSAASNIIIQGGIWDGNGANNSVTANNAQYGVALYYSNNCKIRDITVTGIRGTNRGEVTGGESFSIQTTGSSNIEIIGCKAIGNSYSSSGFSFNISNNILVTNCISYGHGIAQGFTSWKCRGITFVNCIAYSNYWIGFNTEESSDILYANCIGGGISPSVATNLFDADSTLGNYCGFSSLETDTMGIISFVNCAGNFNSADGILANNAAHVRIIGGEFRNNGNAGISIIGTSTDYKISDEPYFKDNTNTEVELPGGWYTWQAIRDTMYQPDFKVRLADDNIYTTSGELNLRPYTGLVKLYNNSANYKLYVYSGATAKVMLNNDENGQIWGTTVAMTDTIKTTTVLYGGSIRVGTAEITNFVVASDTLFFTVGGVQYSAAKRP